MKGVFKILIYILLGLITLIKLAGCFTFRDSQKQAKDTFGKAGYQVQSRMIRAGNYSLHYIQTGVHDERRPVLCFVHGSPGASNNFNNNLLDSSLQSSFEMISVDRPGFGYSNFGDPVPSLAQQASLLKNVLDSFTNRTIILVGHSYGGPLIGQIAADFSDRIAGLIIVAGSIDPDLEPYEWWRKPANSVFGKWLLPDFMTTSNAEIIPLKWDLEQLEPRWCRLKMPVIVIQGGRDNLVPSGNASFAENHLDSVSYLKIHRYPELNHFIPFTNHQIITEAIMEMDSVLNSQGFN